jgi:Protein of unknwon function (DUF3008)
MPSNSKSQQRLMGMVHAYQKGDLKKKDVKSADLWDKVKKMAKSMKPKDTKDFAKTKHTGLPEKVKENKIYRFKDFVNESENKTFDPSYKLTYADDNDLEKAKRDIIEDAMQHIKHIAEYFGTDKADELYGIIENIKNSKNEDELSELLDNISSWFYNNTDIDTESGPSKIKRL